MSVCLCRSWGCFCKHQGFRYQYCFLESHCLVAGEDRRLVCSVRISVDTSSGHTLLPFSGSSERQLCVDLPQFHRGSISLLRFPAGECYDLFLRTSHTTADNQVCFFRPYLKGAFSTTAHKLRSAATPVQLIAYCC